MKNQFIEIRLPDARHRLEEAFREEIPENFSWLQEYETLARWLADNHGLNLLITGFVGLGKSVFAMHILPQLLQTLHLGVNTSSAYQLNENRKRIMETGINVIDDLGVEPQMNDYGCRSWVFPQIIDHAVEHHRLLIVTTNMTENEMLEKYGTRTMDRIRSYFCVVRMRETKSYRPTAALGDS